MAQSEMEYSTGLTVESDVKTDFIITQSCLSDPRHADFLQGCDNITLFDDQLTFNLGDSFHSFVALKKRLDAHSKHSNIHYWMRDTRTVAGARMRTTQHIEPQLKYYSVKYACVYGGYKFLGRGTGLRNVSTLKLTDCPAHVALRVNRSGKYLVVTSVCNHHNHDVSPDISGRLWQGRKLSHELREEVLDMLRMNISKRRVLEYARRGSQHFRYKDVVNLARGVRLESLPAPQRRLQLLEALKKMDIENKEEKGETTADVVTSKLEPKRRRRKPIKQKTITKITENSEDNKEISSLGASELTVCQPTLDVSEFVVESRPVVRTRVKSHDQSNTTEADSNVMEYLYTDCEGDHVFAVLNEGEIVTMENVADETLFTTEDSQQVITEDAQQVIADDEQIAPDIADENLNEDALAQDEMKNYTEEPSMFCETAYAILSEENEMIELNDEDCINQIVVDDQYLELSQDEEEVTTEEIQVMPPEEMHISSESQGDVILEESWIDDATYRTADFEGAEAVFESSQCENCDKIELDLNEEVNTLRVEKVELLRHNELLRQERDKLLKEVQHLQDKECKINNPNGYPLVKPIKFDNRIYLVKI